MDESKANALYGALAALREDPAEFTKDPKAKVPELDDDAVAAFTDLSESEINCILQTDELMTRAGFEVEAGELLLRMV